MTELLTAAQMRAIERTAIDSGEVTGLELMERAGRGVVEAILSRHPNADVEFPCAAVFCGPGNNGGDGFVIARLLRKRGWDVHVFFSGKVDSLPLDARVNFENWCSLGGVLTYDTPTLMGVAAKAREAGHEVWICVDALFGIGQRGSLDQILAPLNALIQASFDDEEAAPTPFFFCVDVPTGYDTDTGSELAANPVSGTVVTFHGPKLVHEVPNVCQEDIRVIDIGLGPWDFARQNA